MTMTRFVMSFCIVPLLAACGGGTGEFFYLGPGATPAEAVAANDILESTVDGVFFDEGATPSAGLPGGSATYTGIVIGGPSGGTGPDTNYAADVRVTVNFDTEVASGEARNFVTTLPGFGNPAGTVELNGAVFSNAGDGAVLFGGNGEISQNATTADYGVTINATFGGTDATVLGGGHATQIEWLAGPDAGTTSLASDGSFLATRN